MSLSGKERLVTVCGQYCGNCAIYNGAIRDTAAQLRRLLESHGLSRETMSYIPGTEWYDGFERGLDWCGEKVRCGGCRSEERFNPVCELQKCVIQDKGLDFCFECGKFPCDILAKFEQDYFPCIETLRRIKKVGISEWVRQQENQNI